MTVLSRDIVVAVSDHENEYWANIFQFCFSFPAPLLQSSFDESIYDNAVFFL